MIRRPVGSFVLLVAWLAAGCDSEAADSRLPLTIDVEDARTSDSLLHRPELQRIVDLQVDRDGEGLVALLTDASPHVRARALLALASVQDTAALPRILPLLRDPEWAVRRDAALALGQTGRGEAAPAMLSALEREEDGEVRRRLMEAIGKVGDGSAIEPLGRAEIRPDEAAVHLLALARFGIRGIHHPEAVRTLVDALFYDDPEVRENAAYYFGRVTNPDPWSSEAGRLREALDGLEPQDAAAMHLLTGLGRLADPTDRARFTRWATESTDWRIRAHAVRALGSQPDGARVRDALVVALDDPSTHVGVTAATALASRELPRGELERLRHWIDGNPEAWRVAVPLLAALARQGHEEVVVDWMSRWPEDAVVPRSRGLSALAAAPGEDALRVLLAAAASPNPRISTAAVTALGVRWPSDRRIEAMHQRYFQSLRDAVRSRNRGAVGAAAPLILSRPFRSLGALDVLEEAFRSAESGGEREIAGLLLDALGESGEDRLVPLLREVVDHPDPFLRARAARALEQLTGERVEVPVVEEFARPVIDWDALGELGRHPRLVLETEKGRVVVVLAAEEAPMTVQTITALARQGRYDGTPFHRVVPNFVIQGGDFRRGDGSGGPDFRIRSEFNAILYGRGVIGMASSGKDTETSQFFVTHSMQPHLDGGYTAFGWVVEGMEVVDGIFEDDRIVRARVESGAP